MDVEQFAKVTQAAEEILNVYADTLTPTQSGSSAGVSGSMSASF